MAGFMVRVEDIQTGLIPLSAVRQDKEDGCLDDDH